AKVTAKGGVCSRVVVILTLVWEKGARPRVPGLAGAPLRLLSFVTALAYGRWNALAVAVFP
ncbi:MAG: hypothetical protein AAFN92_05175, partial [Bacteroidota bacterium]